jgi:hypothetical protein
LFEIPNHAKLYDISLSNNFFSGTIPISFQNRKYPFKTLSLNNNKLSGTLEDNFVLPSKLLDLRNNRLSGTLPVTFYNIMTESDNIVLDDDFGQVNNINNDKTLAIMKGNLFYCDQSALSEVSSLYQCGSSNLDTAMIYWSAFFIWGVLCIYLGYSYIPQLKIKLDQQQQNENRQEKNGNHFAWLSLTLILIYDSSFQFINTSRKIAETGKLNIKIEGNKSIEVDSPYISGYLNLLINISKLAIRIGLLYLIICASLYTLLKKIPDSPYITYTYQYLWTVTTAHFKGYLPMLIIQIISLYSILDTLKTFSLKNKSVFHILNDIIQNNLNDINTKDLKEISLLRKIEKYSKFFSFQFYGKKFTSILPMSCILLINLTVSSLVNLLYINTVLTNKIQVDLLNVNIDVGEQLLFWVQFLLGLWKTGWTYLFVYVLPEKIQAKYPAIITDKNVFVTQLYMNIFNFIIGPVLLTLFTDSDCFLYFYSGEPQMFINFISPITSCSYTSKYLKNVLLYAIQCSSVLQPYSNVMRPSFTYYNQCSSAVLTNFVPVLIYSYSQVTALKFFLFLYYITHDKYYDYFYMKHKIFMHWFNLNAKSIIRCFKKEKKNEINKKNTRTRTFTEQFNKVYDDDIKLSIIQRKSKLFKNSNLENIEDNPMHKKNDSTENDEEIISLKEGRNRLKTVFIPMDRILDQDEIDAEENIFRNTRKLIISERIKFLNNNNCCDIANLFVVLLCFGQASPLLSVVIVVNILCTNLLAVISVGRYIINMAVESDDCEKKDILESYTLLDEGCSFCIDGLSSQRTGLVIVFTTSLFWGLTLYDVVADVTDFKTAIIVAFMNMFLMPFMVWYLTYAQHDRLLLLLRSFFTDYNDQSLDNKSLIKEEKNENKDKNENIDKNIELTTIY